MFEDVYWIGIFNAAFEKDIYIYINIIYNIYIYIINKYIYILNL